MPVTGDHLPFFVQWKSFNTTLNVKIGYQEILLPFRYDYFNAKKYSDPFSFVF